MENQARATLRLYRSLLKHAKRFPSRNRDSIVSEIKSDFRASRSLAEPKAVAKELRRAVEGLDHLRQFVRLDPNKTTWNFKM